MKPIFFKDAYAQLDKKTIAVPTLGGRSTFEVSTAGNLLTIRTISANDKIYVINGELWNHVQVRVQELSAGDADPKAAE